MTDVAFQGISRSSLYPGMPRSSPVSATNDARANASGAIQEAKDTAEQLAAPAFGLLALIALLVGLRVLWEAGIEEIVE